MQRHEPTDHPDLEHQRQSPESAATVDAEQRLTAVETPVRRAVQGFLGSDDPDHEDMIQLALIGANRYLEDTGSFNGDLGSGFTRLAVSIARNRCRDLLRRRKNLGEVELEPVQEILATPCPTILDEIEHDEQLDLLARSFKDLSQNCQRLLEAGYLKRHSLKELIARLGFKSPQAYYYNRNRCLERLKTILSRRVA